MSIEFYLKEKPLYASYLIRAKRGARIDMWDIPQDDLIKMFGDELVTCQEMADICGISRYMAQKIKLERGCRDSSLSFAKIMQDAQPIMDKIVARQGREIVKNDIEMFCNAVMMVSKSAKVHKLCSDMLKKYEIGG